MIDIYSLLYLPISRKGHIFSVVANELDMSAKTVKRKFHLLRDNSHPYFDVDFWRKHGVLSDEDWGYIQSPPDDVKSTIAMLLPEKMNYIDKIPEEFRFIHPSHLKYASVIFCFKMLCVQNNISQPLLQNACEFILSRMIIFSKICFTLIDNDLYKYNELVASLHLPIFFPGDSVWNIYFATGKIERELDNFVQEIILLMALVFDMAVVAGALTNEESTGKSALLGAMMTLKKNHKFLFRDSFFQDIKNMFKKIQIWN